MAERIYKAGRRRFHYVLMDGTISGDAAVFGRRLETSGAGGWSNLLDFLPLVGESQFGIDAGRLDPGPHLPFLPIYQVPFSQQGGNPKDRRQCVPVVSPNGFNGMGRDLFWRNYQEGDTPEGRLARAEWDDDLVTYGRHTACQRSAKFLNDFFFLRPGVEVPPTPSGEEPRGQVIDWGRHLIPDPDQQQFYADLLYFSSHGFKGGFSVGDSLLPSSEARPQEIPLGDGKPASDRFGQRIPYFMVGELATKRDDGFFGPQWLVFALCSAVNPATWPLWVQVFEKSFPRVRGLLAYEKSAPGNGITVANAFFDQLAAGRTFLEAWSSANSAHKWSAIVHEDAVGDTLTGWADLQALPETRTTKAVGPYRGFSSVLGSEGAQITFSEPPFRLQLIAPRRNRAPEEVRPETLHKVGLLSDSDYLLRVASGDGGPVERIVCRWINIRDDYPTQLRYSQVFDDPQAKTAGAEAFVSPEDPKDFILQPQPGKTLSEIEVVCHSKSRQKLLAAHANDGYHWLRIRMKQAGRDEVSHDFTTQGIQS